MRIRIARWLAAGCLGVPMVMMSLPSAGSPPLTPAPIDIEGTDGIVQDVPAAGRAPLVLEGFDDPTFPPPGWSEQFFSGAAPWDRVTSGSEPTIDPRNGDGMARWNSAVHPAGNATLLSSPPLDLSASVQPTLTFWMSHDAGAAGSNDRVWVQNSTDGGVSWSSMGTAISRYDAACSDACWFRHDIDLTAYAGSVNFYVGLLGISQAGRNIFIDDVAVGEPAPDLSSSTVSAPAEVLEGDPIDYVIEIVNSGGAMAATATLVDALPAGTAYVSSSLVCSSGTTCSYNGVAGQIEWAGSVTAPGIVTISFSVDPSGLPCGTDVVNHAVFDDPDLIGGAVGATVATKIVSTILSLAEGFESATFPPTDWSEDLLVGASSWNRVTGGTNPTITTHSGSGMARWNADTISPGDSTRLVSPAFDLSALTQPTLAFWMSHDDGFPASDDRVTLQVSTDGGTTWSDAGGPISRFDGECATPCWQRHHRDLSSHAGSSNVRIGLAAVAADGNSFFIDDLRVAEPWHPCPHVSLEDDATIGSCQGETIDHVLTVTNGSTITDTLEIFETGAWPTAVDPSSFLLAPGTSDRTTVTVRIPWWADRGDQQVVDLLLAAQGGGLVDQAQVATYAFVAAEHSDLTELPPTPDGLWTRDHSLVFVNGKLFKIGGFSGITQDLTAVYDIATESWTTTDLLPAPRQKLDCVEIDGLVYCAGGLDTTAQDSLFIFDPAAAPGSRWTVGPPMPDARYGYAGVALDGRYYLIGGYTSDFEGTMLVYDPSAGTWAGGPALPPMAIPRAYHAAGAMGGKIVVAGGLTGPSAGTDVTEVYDPVAGSWSEAAPLPYSSWMRGADGVVEDRFLVIVGGYLDDATASDSVLAYDAVNDLWMAPQATAPHQIYAAEGDADGAGNLWYVSGRLYEGGSYAYSPFTTRVGGCPECPAVTGADFTWDPPMAVTLFSTTFTASATGEEPIEYSWDFDGLGSAAGPIVDFVFPGAGTYSVSLTATNCDGTAGDAVAHDVEVVPAPIDLAVEKSNGTWYVIPGHPTTYEITVNNNGPWTANGALVEDSFPGDLTGVTWTCSGYGGGSCDPGGSGDIAEPVDLPPSAQVVFAVTGTVDPAAAGMLINTATVTAPAGAVDPNGLDNSSTDTDEVVTPLFADGFESGNTGAWSSTSPPVL